MNSSIPLQLHLPNSIKSHRILRVFSTFPAGLFDLLTLCLKLCLVHYRYPVTCEQFELR